MQEHDHAGAAPYVRPPGWALALLRFLLPLDQVETVAGDLIEEYRVAVYPSQGRWRANLWFLRELSGFAWRAAWLPLAAGAVLGASLGVLNLVATSREPLADDDGGAMLVWAAAILGVWSVAACAASWRTQRFADAIKAGAAVGVATILVLHVAAIVRVNL